ncbi:hypothetical protein [Paenibacillus jiagnxiensis]|uniref:hypothetical protein n=1 Tax=Paenibacillus jiagnxiensis TaxID=3228926 RepID=UPI0033ACA050
MKKKNKLLAVAALTTLLVGGAGVAYNQTFAAGTDGKADTNVSALNMETLVDSQAENEVEAPVDNQPELEGPQATPPGEKVQQPQGRKTIDIQSVEDINIPLNLADSSSIQAFTSRSAKDNPIVELANAVATENKFGEEIIVSYRLAEGQVIFMSQSEDTLEHKEDTVELAKSWYDPSTVSVEEINGATAVIEDGEARKQIHLITEDKFYTVASTHADNLDYLLEIAHQIQP